MITKKFTVELEVDEESNAELYGDDVLFVVLDHLARSVADIGYDMGRVRYHNGRNSRWFEVRPGDPPTIEERP